MTSSKCHLIVPLHVSHGARGGVRQEVVGCGNLGADEPDCSCFFQLCNVEGLENKQYLVTT